MTKEELQKVRDWAQEKISGGAEPPWAWYQYMKLRETMDAILGGMASTEAVTLPASSPQEASLPGSGHLRLVRSDLQETAQPDPKDPVVQMPM